MSEPTLSLSYRDYADRVGIFLGWGPGNWSASSPWPTSYQSGLVDDCVRSGVRKFYYTTPPYDWSFMHPYVTLQLAANAQSVALPPDVAGVEGTITVKQTGSTAVPGQIDFTTTAKIKLLYVNFPGSVGRPSVAAMDINKGTTALSGQQSKILVFPQADTGYDLEFKAYVAPDAPTPASPYVYGGSQHVETVLECCLSVAEQRVDDRLGVHTQLAAERLAASMAVDGRTKPQLLGYNADRSDEKRRRQMIENHYYPVLGTYNGASLG